MLAERALGQRLFHANGCRMPLFNQVCQISTLLELPDPLLMLLL